jgi:deoxyadenosine/deoxycytidine kinase
LISVVVSLEASHEELWSRVSKRNARHEDYANSIYFAESDLIRYRKRFVAPEPDEPHLVYDGDPEQVLKTLQSELDRT